MPTEKALQWTGVNLRERRQGQARQAVLDTFQWANSGSGWSALQEHATTLAEYDPAYIDLLVDQLLWDQIGGTGGLPTDIENERKTAIESARRAWRSSPLAQWAVQTYTAWGLGDAIAFTAEDETNGQPVLDEFLEADRNAPVVGSDNLHHLSERVLVEGNVFLAFYSSTVDGETTIRIIAQDEIEIIVNPVDALVPWFYKRTFSQGTISKVLFYPDWALYFSDRLEDAWNTLKEHRIITDRDERADLVQNGNERLGGTMEAGTAVCMMHVAHNRKDFTSLWGWSWLTVALPWLRSHKQFAQARLSVALSMAQFVRRSKVSGGSRAVQSVIDTIASNLDRDTYYDTNPPAAAGAWHVENKAVDTTELPMRTGASDAKADNELFAWMTAVGVGLDTVAIGLDTARYATAVQMGKVQSYLMTRYKSFWSSQFQRVARVVFSFAERFGGKSFVSQEISVSVDSFSLPDFPDIVDSESRLMAELHNGVSIGALPAQAVAAIDAQMTRTALQALGVSNADELTSDEAFQIGDYENEEPEEPEQQPPQMVMPVPSGQVPEQPTEEVPPMEALRLVAANYAEGEIDLETLAENVLATWVERANDARP